MKWKPEETPSSDGGRCESERQDAEQIVKALRSQQVDAIVGEGGVSLVRLREVEEQLKESQERLAALNETLEQQVRERTAQLEAQAAQLRTLANELSEAEERERQRIAAVLHDGVQQILVAAAFHLESLPDPPQKAATLADRLSAVRGLINDAAIQTRELSHELAGPDLKTQDLAESIRWIAQHMAQQHGLRVVVDTGPSLRVDSYGVRAFLFRAVRELLFNVAKHAETEEAEVRCRRNDNNVVVTVSDSGIGFDPTVTDSGAGLGLARIRARAAYFGASMTVESSPGEGATCTLVYSAGDAQDR